MDPLSAGAVAFSAWLFNKIIDWTAEKALDAGASGVLQLIKSKLPTAKVVEMAALPPSQREDIGEAVLIEEVKQAAAQDEEVRKAVEDLGNDVQEAAKTNPQLQGSFNTYYQNCKGIVGSNTFNNSTINITNN
ncbi:MAG TPA: hypothetical protein VK184_22860 [Nostocaceae cyanobacterium]|nr:hypothetical protein [Nostocaceae cyanobacterium]